MIFDIFDEREQPMLYIADIVVEATIPVNSKKEKKVIKLSRCPIVLVNNKIPTKKSEEQFFKNIYNKHIGKSEFKKILFAIRSITNVKFSSKLAYKFDYSRH